MERPPWPAGTPFPIERALFNWVQAVLGFQTRRARIEYLQRLERRHGAAIAAQVRAEVEAAWESRAGKL